MEADTRFDIRESIAYPKRYQPKANPRVAYQRYPHMPLGPGNKPFLDILKQPVIWADARAEKEWLDSHPDEAAKIAEHEAEKANNSPRVTNAEQKAAILSDENTRLKSERDKSESMNQVLLEELEAAKAQLAAARKDQAAKVDGRSKEARAARAAEATED